MKYIIAVVKPHKLEEVREAGVSLTATSGLGGAEGRAAAVYAAWAGTSLIAPARAELWGVQNRALAVWARHDGDRLALTEADIEGWIRYASLCREAQGGTVLRISVADRVTVYRMLVDRFSTGSRADRIGLAAIGGYWTQVRDAWGSASYSVQRGWIDRAPLPPPMTASSLGYAEAVSEGDVSAHARVLIEQLGPFTVGGREPTFQGVSEAPR